MVVEHRVTRVRTVETISRPDISELILCGARECGFLKPTKILAELTRDVASDSQGLFIGSENDTPKVVSVGFLPLNAFYLAATVGMAYSERAPRHLVVAVGARLREWLRSCGHDHAMVLNLFHTDRSYVRGLAHFGRGSRIGGIVRFDFE
jgi:hypothetical protein